MSIYDEYKRHPDVHPNIILKTDMVRQGIAVSKRATEQFRQMDDVAWRGYHFFSYNRQETKVFSDKLPMALCLEDGCTVQLETDANSPYLLDFVDDDFIISENNETIAKHIYFFPKARWYGSNERTAGDR